MVQKIFCIVAGQRSGTTAFRSLLSGTGRFTDLGEIFDTATINQPESFFGYARARQLQVTDVLSGPAAEKLCKDYLSVLQKAGGDHHLLFDVKFNSWGIIRMPWTYLHQEPYFLAFLKYRLARIAFVWRKDMVAQILSDRISAAIGKWHNLEPGDARKPVTLDIEEIRTRTKLMCLSEAYFFENLQAYPHTMMLCYETLFDARGSLNSDVQSRISQLMHEKYVFPETGIYRQNTINKSQIVTNYDDAVAAVEEMIKIHRLPLLAENTELC